MAAQRIGVFGASGFVGDTLGRLAERRGIQVKRFSRSARPGFHTFSGPQDLDGLDAVVNLAGEPILGLWTPERKKRIRESRVTLTGRIASAMQGTTAKILVNASAVGFYGDTGEQEVDESSPHGSGFLAETCLDWERAATAAAPGGTRTVLVRIGFVIGPGGAMRLIRPLFRAGLGGRLGSGKQWMSFIHVEDVAGMILWAAERPDVSGPVNAVMPEPLRNSQFTAAVAAAVRRPAILPAPAFALRLVLGGLSSVMLDSSRVRPSVASRLGYAYAFPGLKEALQSTGTL